MVELNQFGEAGAEVDPCLRSARLTEGFQVFPCRRSSSSRRNISTEQLTTQTAPLVLFVFPQQAYRLMDSCEEDPEDLN